MLSRAEAYASQSPFTILLLAIGAISTSAILVRWSSAPSVVLAMYRVGLTTVFLLPFLFTRYRGEFTAFRRTDWLIASITGAALALHFAAFFESLTWTSVAASVTLVQSQPLFVAIGAALVLNERFGIQKIGGIFIAIVGMIVLSASELFGGGFVIGPRPLYGNSLALFGAVMAAIYVLVGRSLRQRISILPYVLIVYTSCTITLFAIAVAQGHPFLGYDGSEWILFIALAVGPGLLGHTLINWVLRYLPSSIVSVSLLGEPVGATLLAIIFLAEIPPLTTVIAAGIILGGIYLTALANR